MVSQKKNKILFITPQNWHHCVVLNIATQEVGTEKQQEVGEML